MPNMSKSKKPDRFNAIVKKAQYGAALPFIFIDEAAQLLRAEHRAVVRLVKRQVTFTPSNMDEEMIPFPESQWIDRDDLLNALARRMQ